MNILIGRKFLLGAIIFSGLIGSIAPVSAANSAGEYRQLGLSYRQQGRYSQAIAAMQKSVELEPENVTGRVNLGWTQHLAGKQQDAAISLWQAIFQQPLFVPAYNALGIVYLVDGNLSLSVTVHTWAAILKPNNEIAYFNLSLALHRLKIYPLAIAAGDRAAVLEPNNPHPLVASAISYWDSGDRIFAQKAYHQAIKLDSRYKKTTFLSHLKQAAFTPEQIQVTKEILRQISDLQI
ncbi:MAG: tetratricopeptide repeat protein [Cyanobacteria bacterium J06639_18]